MESGRFHVPICETDALRRSPKYKRRLSIGGSLGFEGAPLFLILVSLLSASLSSCFLTPSRRSFVVSLEVRSGLSSSASFTIVYSDFLGQICCTTGEVEEHIFPACISVLLVLPDSCYFMRMIVFFNCPDKRLDGKLRIRAGYYVFDIDLCG